MSTDGGLPKLFTDRLDGHWQRVETFSTGQGVPDLNFCIEGRDGWIEAKQTAAWAVSISPEQIGWAERRIRNGGRVFLAVRRQSPGGARTKPCDELWLFDGRWTRRVKDGGLKGMEQTALLLTTGSARNWNWQAVRNVLTDYQFPELPSG